MYNTNAKLDYTKEVVKWSFFVSIVIKHDLHVCSIHVIFSWAQIGTSAIFGREIGVPDREIFSRQKIFKFNVDHCKMFY